MNINGRTTQQIALVLPVQGNRTGLAQVVYAAEGGRRSSCSIKVQMPEGDVVHVQDDGDGGGAIDVEFREVR